MSAETMLALVCARARGGEDHLRGAGSRAAHRRRSPHRAAIVAWAPTRERARRGAAALPRGAVLPLGELRPEALDALIIPGGRRRRDDAVELRREGRALRGPSRSGPAAAGAACRAQADGVHRPRGAAGGARAGAGRRRAAHAGHRRGPRGQARRRDGRRRPPVPRRRRDRRPEVARDLDAGVDVRRRPARQVASASRSWCVPAVGHSARSTRHARDAASSRLR